MSFLVPYIPYIGITGFTSWQEVELMFEVFTKYKPRGSVRQLHVGVMMSRKTLLGLPTKWTHFFPPKEEVGNIFLFDQTYTCLHYADDEHDPDLLTSLDIALYWAGPCVRALQLDMVWPDPGKIATALAIGPRNAVEVILQVGRKALDAVNNDPALLVEKLRSYENTIDRVLLDKSGGEGRALDADELLPFARAIRWNFPTMGLVVAGGLGPDTLDLAQSFLDEFPDASIDAQSGVTTTGSALGPLDMKRGSKYLARALRMFG